MLNHCVHNVGYTQMNIFWQAQDSLIFLNGECNAMSCKCKNSCLIWDNCKYKFCHHAKVCMRDTSMILSLLWNKHFLYLEVIESKARCSFMETLSGLYNLLSVHKLKWKSIINPNISIKSSLYCLGYKCCDRLIVLHCHRNVINYIM